MYANASAHTRKAQAISRSFGKQDNGPRLPGQARLLQLIAPAAKRSPSPWNAIALARVYERLPRDEPTDANI